MRKNLIEKGNEWQKWNEARNKWEEGKRTGIEEEIIETNESKTYGYLRRNVWKSIWNFWKKGKEKAIWMENIKRKGRGKKRQLWKGKKRKEKKKVIIEVKITYKISGW